MKIRISTLLLTNAFFLHFGEINAAKQRSGPHIRTHTLRGKGQIKGGVITVVVDADDGPDYKTVIYGMKPIQVWLDVTRSYVRKAYFPNCRIPQGPFYKEEHFLIRYANLQGIGLVAYVSEQGDLIGVKPPNMAGSRTLRPTPTEWYINYFAKKFKLAVNPDTKTVYEISLLSGNIHHVGQHTAYSITVAKIKFKVFRDKNTHISGAELEQPYVYTVG